MPTTTAEVHQVSGIAGSYPLAGDPLTLRTGAPMSSFNKQHAKYNELAAEAAATLDDQLDRIRHDQDEGTITIRQAADERVQVMQEHLDRLRLLAAEYL